MKIRLINTVQRLREWLELEIEHESDVDVIRALRQITHNPPSINDNLVSSDDSQGTGHVVDTSEIVDSVKSR